MCVQKTPSEIMPDSENGILLYFCTKIPFLHPPTTKAHDCVIGMCAREREREEIERERREREENFNKPTFK